MSTKSDTDELSPLTPEELQEIIDIARQKDPNVEALISPGILFTTRHEAEANNGSYLVAPAITEDGIWCVIYAQMDAKAQQEGSPLFGTYTRRDGRQVRSDNLVGRKDIIALTETSLQDEAVLSYLGCTKDNFEDRIVHYSEGFYFLTCEQPSASAIVAYYKMLQSE